ncbi:MAG: hypothetical protein ABIV51_07085 [Saprospiraceae bacterium]
MRSNRLLLIIMVALIAAAGIVYFGWYQEEVEAPIEYERSFGTKNIDQVSKIFMADKFGNKITLVKKANVWYLDGKTFARNKAVELLLETCQRMTIKYVPTKSSIKNIVKDLATNSIKVELYDELDKKIKAFYVAGTNADGTGTYGIMEGAENPFVLEIPGFIGDLSARFFLDKDEWKDRTVFNVTVDSIAQVQVIYTGQVDFSFQINRQGKSYELKSLDKDGKAGLVKSAKQGNISAFLYGFENQIAEAVVTEDPALKELHQQVPFVTYKISTISHRELEYKLFPILPDGQTMADVNVDNKMIERYHVISSSGDIFLVQTLNFKKILWAYSFFFENLSQSAAPLNN